MRDMHAIHYPTRSQSRSHYHAWCSATALAVVAFGVTMLARALLHAGVDATTTLTWVAVLCPIAIPIVIGAFLGAHSDIDEAGRNAADAAERKAAQP
ncbi:MAG TPA: hypothetical protein VFQ88_07800 [Nevskiaceae bacterium]|nr:hypothetical protein [Nevskiaceae bacterium]